MLGIIRGRYLTPAFAIKIGETAIRNCIRDQLAAMRQEGLDYMGDHPCVFTEIGIPFDMDDKYAYKTGDYSSQLHAMDANCFGLEGSMTAGYSIWAYVATVCTAFLLRWHPDELTLEHRTITGGAIAGMAKTCPSSPWTTHPYLSLPSTTLPLTPPLTLQTHLTLPPAPARAATPSCAPRPSKAPSPHPPSPAPLPPTEPTPRSQAPP